jgi:hypothetical protein
VDLSKLTTSDKMILGGGLAYLIFMFFPWYGIDYSAFGVSQSFTSSGWDYFLGGILPLILILVMCSHVLVSAFSDTELPEPPVPWAQVHLGTGIVAAVLVVLRLLIASDDYGSIDTGVNLDRKFGLFLAVIAAIVVAVGGVKKSQEGDTTPSSGGTGSAPF